MSIIPALCIAALSPKPAATTAFGVDCTPLTIEGVLALADTPFVDSTLQREPTSEDYVLAAMTILQLERHEFVSGLDQCEKVQRNYCPEDFDNYVDKNYGVIVDTIKAAFATFVPTADPGETDTRRAARFGWPLELVEFLMSEYKISYKAALKIPLATAFALRACAHARYGGKFAAPGYVEAEQMAEFAKLNPAKNVQLQPDNAEVQLHEEQQENKETPEGDSPNR